jgi:hypothetical protein
MSSETKKELMVSTAGAGIPPRVLDGWDRDDGDGDGRDGSQLLYWTREIGWHDHNDKVIPYGTRGLTLLECTTMLQRWKDGKPTVISRDRVTGELPDEHELNSQIPQAEWEINKFTGMPEPPWAKHAVFYLVNYATGQTWRHINKSSGTWMLYQAMRNQVKTRRHLSGACELPEITLQSAAWHSAKFSPQLRADFEIVGWRRIGGNPVIAAEPAKAIAQAIPIMESPNIAAGVERFDDVPPAEPPSEEPLPY